MLVKFELMLVKFELMQARLTQNGRKTEKT